MAEVHLPRSLVALFPGTPRRLIAHGETVADVIASLDAQVPGIRNRLLDAGPSIRTHINVFVAGQRAALSTPVPADAVVHVIPAVSGGEDRFAPLPPAEARPNPTAQQATQPEGATAGNDALSDPRALQILSTEHWSLLTARSLVYNEAFARGGMFLALLSATLVALGLISTATGFSDEFLIVAGVVLALDLFVGLASLGRIGASSGEDLRYLQGMNRLRHAYFEIVPGLERYFITTGHDDFESVAAMYGPQDAGPLRELIHGFTTMLGMIGVICSAIVGILGSLVTLLLTHDGSLAGVIGIVAALAFFLFASYASYRLATGFARRMPATFPRPERRAERGRD
jgi:molybdopterin converting factor small subunit